MGRNGRIAEQQFRSGKRLRRRPDAHGSNDVGLDHHRKGIPIRDGPRFASSRREAPPFRRLAGFDPVSIYCSFDRQQLS